MLSYEKDEARVGLGLRRGVEGKMPFEGYGESELRIANEY